MSVNLAEELMGTSLGGLLTTQDAKDLADKAQHRTVRAGDCLFKSGDKGDAIYIVLSGSFDVVLGQPGAGATVVASVGAGQVVGELELMTKSLRMATLVSPVESQVLEIAGTTLDAMLQQNHAAANKVVVYIAKTLARRLASVNQRIVERSPRAPAAAPVAGVAPVGAPLPAVGGAPRPPPSPAGARPPVAPPPVAKAPPIPAPKAAAPVAAGEATEISDADVVAVGDEDLEVLDRLWG